MLIVYLSRATLSIINENVPKQVSVQTALIRQISRSSSESGISSNSSTDDLVVRTTTKLETLV